MKPTIAIIDFGTSKIVTVVAEQSDSLRSNIIAQETFDYDGYLNDNWNNPEQLNDAIKYVIEGAEKQCGRTIKEIYVGVPGTFTKVHPIEVSIDIQGADPHITDYHINQLFAEADQHISSVPGATIYRSPAWFMVDGGKKTLRPVGMKGTQLKSLISYELADRFFIDDVTARLADLNITAMGFLSTNIGEALLYVPEAERDHTALLLDVGFLCTDVMVIEGDTIIFQQCIPMGGADLTAELTEKLQIQMCFAEDIKQKFVYGISKIEKEYTIQEDAIKSRTFTQEEVSAAITPKVDELCELISTSIAEGGVKFGSWSNCYLTGGGIAFNSNGKEYLTAKLNITVRFSDLRTSKLNTPNYASTLGLLNLVLDLRESQKPVSTGIAGFFKRLFGD